MGAKPSFYMKFIATYAPAFFGYNNPVLARVIVQTKKNLADIWFLKEEQIRVENTSKQI